MSYGRMHGATWSLFARITESRVMTPKKTLRMETAQVYKETEATDADRTERHEYRRRSGEGRKKPPSA
jgi:hypothetical protein